MKTILLVDDNPSIRKSYENLLSDLGYKVILAVDGVEGLELAISNIPDLIVADRDMPRMNGYEMARQLKSNPKTKNIPILGRGDFEKEEQKILDYYLPKCTGNISEKVAEILDQR
jgi:CheY-like chemotaxis protein